MSPIPFDLVSWLLAGTAFVAVGGLIAAVLAIARLGPLLAGGREPGVGHGERRG